MLKVLKPNNDTYLIKQSLKNSRIAQKMLYEKYSPKMLGLCSYYVKDYHMAEEVMLNGFFKVFTKLNQFEFKGSFEGWIRKIMIWESLSYLRKKNNLVFTDSIEDYENSVENEVELSIAVEEIQNYINELPDACKVVFNLYVIEGYKHAEIAKLLSVTTGTTKTQLSRARKFLQAKISLNQKQQHGQSSKIQ